MTPDPASPPPEDGVDPADDPLPQPFGPLVGPVFWLLIASSLICILAAVIIASAGPKIFPGPGSPAATPHGLGKRHATR